MRISYTIDERAGLVTFRLGGVPDVEAVRDALEHLREDPRFRPGMDVLTDRRELAAIPTSEYTLDLVELIRTQWPSRMIRRWAILARPGAAYGMARMAEMRAAIAGSEIAAFIHESDALEWLLRPEED
jgi:hypothetical protein